MAKMRRRYGGNALLYHTLLVVVLCSYSIPVYMGITQTIPYTSSRTMWFLNFLALLVLVSTLKPVWNWVQPRVHHVVYAIDEHRLRLLGI